MNLTVQSTLKNIFNQNHEILSNNWSHDFDPKEKIDILKKILETTLQQINTVDKERILNELEKWGPLESLLNAEDISEILVNRYDQIFYEKAGLLYKSEDHFYSEQTYNDAIERICQYCHSFINKEKTFIEVQIGHLRISVIYKDLARGQHLLSIRKQPQNRFDLHQLYQKNWCTEIEKSILQKILSCKRNFIVIGGTSSVKTTVLQALMKELPANERLVIIEDTQELMTPNELSTSLLSRGDFLNPKNNITMTDLLKRSLRLRPDRLVIGEIRGGEATDLLMALSTGHEGSFGSLHAKNHNEALLRLEMLVQMGAPQWSQNSIRRLIGLTLNYIIVVHKENGVRSLQGIYKITSVESTGISSYKIENLSEID